MALIIMLRARDFDSRHFALNPQDRRVAKIMPLTPGFQMTGVFYEYVWLSTLFNKRLRNYVRSFIAKRYERLMRIMLTNSTYLVEHMPHKLDHNPDILPHNLCPFQPHRQDCSISCWYSQSGHDTFNTNWNADCFILNVLCSIDSDELLQILRWMIFK